LNYKIGIIISIVLVKKLFRKFTQLAGAYQCLLLNRKTKNIYDYFVEHLMIKRT